MKKKMKKRVVTLGILLATGLVLAGIGAVAGVGGVFQGEPENIEVHSADGRLLIFRQHTMIDNVPMPNFPETHDSVFITGEDGESAAVGIPPPVLRGRISMVKPISGGARIDLDIPTSEEIEQMREESQKAVDEAIRIIENQKGISVERVRACVVRSSEELGKIDEVELWITSVENEGITVVHAIVDWDTKKITLFENISEHGMIPLPPETTMDMEKLEEARQIAMHDNRVKEITEGQRYTILPGTMTEKEGELILGIESASYRIIVDLENSRVKSVEEIERPQPPIWHWGNTWR
jgi:hypothetical protein